MDGDGLMLVVRATGKKSWVLRYQMNGVRRDMGLGSYPEIGLKEARQRTADARRMIEAGNDPIDRRQAAQLTTAKPIPTFGGDPCLRRSSSPTHRRKQPMTR